MQLGVVLGGGLCFLSHRTTSPTSPVARSAWGKGWAAAGSLPTVQTCPLGREEASPPTEAKLRPSSGSELTWPELSRNTEN